LLATLPSVVSRLDHHWRIIDGFFPEQSAAYWRPLQNRVGVAIRGVLGTRRCGKTWGALGSFFTEAMMFPNSHYRYVMLTQDQVRDVIWPVAHEIIDEYGIDAVILDDALKIRFPNKSMIHGYGADKKGWMGRMKGIRNRGACIDEAGEFSRPADLEELINVVLRPTLVDDRGTLWLQGTPGKWKQGVFYDVTATDKETGVAVGTGRLHGWDVFNWGAAHNPKMAEQFMETMDQIRREHPGVNIMKIPSILREWFGRWEEDDSNRVYHVDPTRNRYPGPWLREKHPNARFVGGIDLGWNDPSAILVGADEPETDCWYPLEAYKKSEAPLDWVVQHVKRLELKYPGIVWVCDPAKKQLMMELQLRCDIYIEAAEKHDKGDWVTLQNRDWDAGKIKVVNFDESLLVEEAVDLRWVRRPSGKVEEMPGLPNDVCDAHLYAYRKAMHFRHKEAVELPAVGSPEYWAREAAKMRKLAIQKQKEPTR